MFGTKRLLAEKDARIAELKEQIAVLRSLVIPSQAKRVIPEVQMEADAVLSGQEEISVLNQKEVEEQEAIESEASRLLSGSY